MLVVPAFAKNTRTLKCHYFLSGFFDGDIFRNEIFETKGNNPISFSVNSYSPTDTTYSHKCEVVIDAGIREDKICLRNFEENREWETGWYESTTEKVHNKFYKRIENGYKQSRHIIHKEEIYHGIKLYVLTPEALVIYRKLISEIRKVFTEDDIEPPKPNNNSTDKEKKDNKDIDVNKDNNKEEEKANKAKEEKKEKMYYCSRIIIQKYIERPLLYYGRKCDIRIWVLLTQNMKVYVFKEGHLKTCSVLFDIDSKDAFTHITNYSFQKYNYNFQKFEKGNEVPFYDFQKFIDDKCNKENYKLNVDLMNKVKEIIKLSMLSVKDKINKNNRTYQFEIFGYDFMLDDNFNVFLIEINTNPGLEESSPWIKVIVPRMLDDALRLTLDQLFEPKYDFSQNYKKLDELDILENVLNNLKNNNESNEEGDDKNKDKSKINNKKYISPFPVPGYEDDENLWDFVCDLNAKDSYDENLNKNDNESNNDNKNNNKEQPYTGIKHLLRKKSNLSKIIQ